MELRWLNGRLQSRQQGNSGLRHPWVDVPEFREIIRCPTCQQDMTNNVCPVPINCPMAGVPEIVAVSH
jgi:hypothetical protein